MRNTAFFQQENALTSIMEKLKEERELILNKVKDSENKILRAMQVTENETSDNRDDMSKTRQENQSVNSTLSDRTQLEILQLLKESFTLLRINSRSSFSFSITDANVFTC